MVERLWIFFIAFIIMVLCPQIIHAATASNVTYDKVEEAYLRARASTPSNYFVPTAEQTSSVGAQKIIVDINSSGKRVGLNFQDEIHIKLEANGSTGYQWYVDEPGTDKNLFGLIGEDRIETSMLVGSPMIYIWKLRAIKPGSGIIRMKYYRIWEGSDSAIKQFEIGVDIN